MLEALQLFVYFIVLFSGIYLIAINKYANTPLQKYFILAFLAKAIGGLFFGVIYAFYYGGGDTLNYFHDCQIIFNAFLESPFDAFRIIFEPEIHYDFGLHQYTTLLWYDRDPASFMVIRFCSVVNILGLNSFWSTTLLMSTISFLAVWMMYRSLVKIFPAVYKELAIAILFMPSVFFWGSGIMKDTVTLLFLALFISATINLKFKRTYLSSTLLIGVSFGFMLVIKAYVAACLVPAVLMFGVIELKSNIKNAALRSAVTPIVLAITILGSVVLLNAAEEYLGKFALSKFDQTVESYVWWHSKVVKEIQHGDGSHYSLGQIGGQGLVGLLFKFPQAVNVSLFRPYLWEARNPIMLLTALESLFVLYVTIRMFRKIGAKVFFISIFQNQYISFAMVYALLFSFAVGLASNNFGALARYKIPGLVMYMIALALMEYFYAPQKSVRK